ncbi:Ribosomal large subunit pseudouridine synthase A [Anatilimnocola aggregata]|uniref:Ribosomal large subunit pseudouridine synthase A n=1 Tax=Anatilimnocola aggregata TaxID=2528021 RepID=A0A517YMW0_9BACT|nr:RluA family pseudouridine synthase [Anatilimnocola aggregata]QDU31558.1 Ribosomal large subunit pseudouridine synthase A [Anatilimnocola aggregata]
MPSGPALPKLVVLYEDNHLLVVNKRAGIATMGVTEDEPSVARQAKAYLKQKYNKPGNVYLGVVSRIDATVSGVLVFARTSKAAARLSEQFRERETSKLYWAIVERTPRGKSGQLIHWVAKDERQQKMVIAAPQSPGAQEAKMNFRMLAKLPAGELLEIELLTGRKHQIRLQLSAVGAPILGDRKYGSGQPFADGIALHARELTIAHPVTKQPLKFVAPLPAAWQPYGVTE